MSDHIPTIHMNDDPDRFDYHVTCSCGWRQSEACGDDNSVAAFRRAEIEHFNAYRASMSKQSNTKENTMTPKTINIDGTEYIRVTDLPAGPPTEYRIVVADRGFVFVGSTVAEDDGSLTITGAKCIRVWGTDESKPGLGWLAQNGPTDKTKLDSSGTVRVPKHAVVMTIDTDVSLWL